MQGEASWIAKWIFWFIEDIPIDIVNGVHKPTSTPQGLTLYVYVCVSDLEWHEPHHDTGDQVMRPLICPAGKSAEVPDLCQPSWAQWIPMDPNGSMDTENLTRNMMICLSVFNYDAVSPPKCGCSKTRTWFQDQNV